MTPYMRAFLIELATLLDKYQTQLSYTIDDDGVHASFADGYDDVRDVSTAADIRKLLEKST